MTTLEIDWFFTHVDGAAGWLHILTIPVIPFCLTEPRRL